MDSGLNISQAIQECRNILQQKRALEWRIRRRYEQHWRHSAWPRVLDDPADPPETPEDRPASAEELFWRYIRFADDETPGAWTEYDELCRQAHLAQTYRHLGLPWFMKTCVDNLRFYVPEKVAAQVCSLLWMEGGGTRLWLPAPPLEPPADRPDTPEEIRERERTEIDNYVDKLVRRYARRQRRWTLLISDSWAWLQRCIVRLMAWSPYWRRPLSREEAEESCEDELYRRGRGHRLRVDRAGQDLLAAQRRQREWREANRHPLVPSTELARRTPVTYEAAAASGASRQECEKRLREKRTRLRISVAIAEGQAAWHQGILDRRYPVRQRMSYKLRAKVDEKVRLSRIDQYLLTVPAHQARGSRCSVQHRGVPLVASTGSSGRGSANAVPALVMIYGL